jgi:hypothetical protein
MTSEGEGRPHTLYRFYGASDELLYVGISVHAPSRFSQHMGDKPWWLEVSRITLEHWPDRASVLEAERLAIKSEHPRYNVVHRVAVPTSASGVAPLVIHGGPRCAACGGPWFEATEEGWLECCDCGLQPYPH